MASDNHQKIVASLQSRLTALIGLSLAIREAHWNVKGPNFHSVHVMLGDFYDAVDDFIDSVAERIVQIGSLAKASKSSMTSGEPETSVGALLSNLHGDTVKLSEASAAAAEEAISAGDVGTGDLLTRLCQSLDKNAWFMAATLGKSPGRYG